MIEELVLERLLSEVAEEIEIPADGAQRVVHELGVSVRETPRLSPRSTGLAMVAAAVVVIAGLGLLISSSSRGSSAKSARAPIATSPSLVPGGTGSERAKHGPSLGIGGSSGAAAFGTSNGGVPEQNAVGVTPTTMASARSSVAGGPVDSAKIVETGSLDLQVSHDTLHTAVNQVTGVANGFGGYVANSNASYDGPDATAEIKIRVPVNDFQAALKQLRALPDIVVLGDSETGKDVTAQYTNLQAQLTAATGEESSLLEVLSHASSIGDILAVRDRITSVDSEIDQLQGQINLLSDQAAFSAISITVSEKPVVKPHKLVHHAAPPTGLSKSWTDARQGFANSVEWLIARSGGALIVLLAALALLFGLRYLYPVVRRGLL